MDTTTYTTYSIRADRLSTLHKKMEQIRRRAAKLGVEAPVVEVGASYDVFFTRANGAKRRVPADQVAELRASMRPMFAVRYVDVEVAGAPVKLAGWTFVAALEHLAVDGEAANLLRLSPHYRGPALPERFRTDSPENCDHCHKHIRRLQTYVVHSEGEAGEWKQVGSGCLQDFLDGADPRAAVARLEWDLDLQSFFGAEEGEGSGAGVLQAASIEGYLAQVAACVRVDGYTSRRKARDLEMNATADDVLDLTISPPPQPTADWKRWAESCAVTDADLDLAAKALEYARTDSLAEQAARAADDFLYNLWVVAKQDAITPKLAGLAAYLVPFYQREVEREVLRRAERESLGASKHVGSEGERLLVQVQILSVRSVGQGSAWGTALLHKALTDAGDVVVWFDRADRDALDVGSAHWLKGTVKAHKEYNGVKETTISRVSLITAEQAELERTKAARKVARAAKKGAALQMGAA